MSISSIIAMIAVHMKAVTPVVRTKNMRIYAIEYNIHSTAIIILSKSLLGLYNIYLKIVNTTYKPKRYPRKPGLS